MCFKITSITLPETLEYIGPGAFGSCEALEELIIPDSVKEMGEYVFLYCRNLKKIHWPTSTTAVPDYAFDECRAEDFIIENGENITSIGEQAFISMRFKDFPYWDNLKEIGSEAFKFSGLTYVKIPEGCKLGNDVFYWCSSLRTIELPKDCPDNISAQFEKDDRVRLITIAAPVPPALNEDWAARVSSICVLEVPDESLELYRNAEYWKNFSEIITSGVETVEASRFSAIGLSGSLRVNSVKEATVFDMQGTRLHTGLDFELQLPAGIYIVKSGETERKVQVK